MNGIWRVWRIIKMLNMEQEHANYMHDELNPCFRVEWKNECTFWPIILQFAFFFLFLFHSMIRITTAYADSHGKKGEHLKTLVDSHTTQIHKQWANKGTIHTGDEQSVLNEMKLSKCVVIALLAKIDSRRVFFFLSVVRRCCCAFLRKSCEPFTELSRPAKKDVHLKRKHKITIVKIVSDKWKTAKCKYSPSLRCT